MSSAKRNILDIKKAAASRAKAHEEMRPLFSVKPERLRVKRRRQRIVIGAIGTVLGLALFGGIAGLSHLQRLAVTGVEVQGAVAIPAESLVASVMKGLTSDGFRLFATDNMFLYPQQAIEATLSREFPRIKEVALSRESLLAQAVTVTVKERQPYARWCPGMITERVYSDTRCHLMDAAGFIFAEAAGEATTVPFVFRGGLVTDFAPIGQWYLRGRLADAVALLGKLAAAGHAPTGLAVESEQYFAVALGTGPVIYAPFGKDADALVQTLETALKAESLEGRISTLEYIDLRFGDRVYYK